MSIVAPLLVGVILLQHLRTNLQEKCRCCHPSKETRARSENTNPALAVSPKAEQIPPLVTNDKKTGAVTAPEKEKRDNFTNTDVKRENDPPAPGTISGTKDVDGIGRGDTSICCVVRHSICRYVDWQERIQRKGKQSSHSPLLKY